MKRSILQNLLLCVLAMSFVVALPDGEAKAGTSKFKVDGDELLAHYTGYRHYHYRRYRYQTYRRPMFNSKRSFYFGLEGFGTGIITTSKDVTQIIRSGGGYNIFGGYRFNHYGALELGLSGSFHGLRSPTTSSIANLGTGLIQAITLDGKIYVARRSWSVEPYFQVGGGVYMFLRHDYSGNELTGGGIHLGVGVDFRLNRLITLGLRVLWKGIYVDDARSFYGYGATESAFMNQIAGGINVQFHFGRY